MLATIRVLRHRFMRTSPEVDLFCKRDKCEWTDVADTWFDNPFKSQYLVVIGGLSMH